MRRTQHSTHIRVTAVVFALLMIGSVPAMALAGNTGGRATPDGSGVADVGTSSTVPDKTNTSAPIADGLSDADGEVEVIVRFDAPAVSNATSADVAVNQFKRHAESTQEPFGEWARETPGVTIQQSFWIANAALVTVDTGPASQGDPLRALARQPNVDRIHRNFEVTTVDRSGSAAGSIEPELDAAVPDANADSTESGSTSTQPETTDGVDVVNASEVWDAYGTKGEGTSVAVLDTGVDPDHPDIDIASENWAEFDTDGNEVDSEPYDSAEHGTHVSGTVSGGNASGEYIGVAPGTELMHGKVLDGGSGSFAAILAGMQWAVEQDADVVSMSLGASGKYADFIDPVQNAKASGSVVVAAAGNDGDGTTDSPGNVYESFAIGASNGDGEIAPFSGGEGIDTDTDWGDAAPEHWPDEYVVPNVAAPGVTVKSSVPGGDYDNTFSGTSMATPHVAGTVALMRAAAEDEPSAERIEATLSATAWKPDGGSDGQDTRYGHGIIDGKRATDRVAADSGLSGTVTDEDGEPIEGATVTLGGYSRTTNASGQFHHRAGPGEYDLAVSAFGHETLETTVAIEDETVTEKNLTLSSAVDARVLDGQPEAIESGADLSTATAVSNLESLTVYAGGDYEGTLTLRVNGNAAEFGQPYEFNGTHDGDVTITVDAEDGTEGPVTLTHTYAGPGDEIELSTGPTYVIDEYTTVGIVDRPDGSYGSQVRSLLETYAHPRFDFEVVETDEVMDAVDDDAYEVYVVQHFGPDGEALTEEFLAETESARTGVVLLDQYSDGATVGGAASDAIPQAADATSDPRFTGDGSTALVSGPVSVEYTARIDHPIFDGVASEGQTVAIATPEPALRNNAYFGGFHSFFEGYDGRFDSRELASVQLSSSWRSSGTGLAVDPFSRTVLASSLGLNSLVTDEMVNDNGGQILANAVEYATDVPPIVPTENQVAKVEPGDSVTVTLDAEALQRLKVGIADQSTYDETDLSLYIDGSINAFDEWRAYGSPRDGEIEVRVAVHEDAGAGTLSLDHTFVAGEDDESIDLTTGPTAVYEGDTLSVDAGGDGDVKTLSAAAEYVEPGGDIVVEDGTYFENDTDYDGPVSAAVVVDTPGTTIRAAEGADPTVLPDDYVITGDVISIQADDVHVEGLAVNARNGSTYESVYDGVGVRNGASGVSVEELAVGGTNGVLLGEGSTDVRVEDVVGYEAYTLVGTEQFAGPVTDVWIENVSIGLGASFMHEGVRLTNAENATVTESTITDVPSGTPGIYADDSGNLAITDNVVGGIARADAISVSATRGETLVENNTVNAVTGTKDYPNRPASGIYANAIGPAEQTVVNNTVTDAAAGVTVENGSVTTVERNTIAAERGLSLTAGYDSFDATTIESVTYNDLSGSDVPFHADSNVTKGGSDKPARVDARLNYVGERNGSDRIATVDGELGGFVDEPFVTEVPSALEREPAETANIGVDLTLEAGETYGVGVPGPSDSTIGEMFDEDFEGVVYGFDAASQSWTMLEGDDTVDSLNAMLVVAETDTRLAMDFQSPDASPPMPGSYELQDGWNFVTAPAHTDADDAYGNYVADGQPVISMFEAPGRQLGSAGDLDGTYMLGSGDAPTLSAFEGYFVFSGEDGERMPTRFGADPTADELYGALNADEPFGGSDVEAISATSLLERADETNGAVSEERLSDALYGQFERSLSTADDPRIALTSTAGAIVAEADDDQLELLETAMEDALGRLVDDEFAGQPEASLSEDVVREVLDDEFSTGSTENGVDSTNETAPATIDAGSSTAPAVSIIG